MGEHGCTYFGDECHFIAEINGHKMWTSWSRWANPTTNQHEIVNIQLKIVTWRTNQDKCCCIACTTFDCDGHTTVPLTAHVRCLGNLFVPRKIRFGSIVVTPVLLS